MSFMSRERVPLWRLVLAAAVASASICCGGLAETHETNWPMPQWQCDAELTAGRALPLLAHRVTRPAGHRIRLLR
jgi:hypothetical protein